MHKCLMVSYWIPWDGLICSISPTTPRGMYHKMERLWKKFSLEAAERSLSIQSRIEWPWWTHLSWKVVWAVKRVEPLLKDLIFCPLPWHIFLVFVRWVDTFQVVRSHCTTTVFVQLSKSSIDQFLPLLTHRWLAENNKNTMKILCVATSHSGDPCLVQRQSSREL